MAVGADREQLAVVRRVSLAGVAAGVDLFDDVDPLMAEAFTEQAAGTPLLPALRAARRTTFDRLSVEKSWSTASPVAATS